MTYQETVDWMFSQLPMYQRQGKAAFKKDLTNIIAFCFFKGETYLLPRSIPPELKPEGAE